MISPIIFSQIEESFELDETGSEKLDETEPPFRKAGQFDPYSDDPRLAVKKVILCSKTGTLIVGGTAGNVIVINLNQETDNEPLKVTTINLVSDRDGFIWKGHDQLKVKMSLQQTHSSIQNGLQFKSVLQILPPAAITCLAVETSWNLLAAGTAHGLVMFDFKHDRCVLQKCTLNPHGKI